MCNDDRETGAKRYKVDPDDQRVDAVGRGWRHDARKETLMTVSFSVYRSPKTLISMLIPGQCESLDIPLCMRHTDPARCGRFEQHRSWNRELQRVTSLYVCSRITRVENDDKLFLPMRPKSSPLTWLALTCWKPTITKVPSTFHLPIPRTIICTEHTGQRMTLLG
jgi:hypothetical protein